MGRCIPKAWRGAAFQDGSSIGCSQAGPGNVSTCGSSIGRCIPQQNRLDGQKLALGIPASRPLLTDRAATVRSGSPPDLWACTTPDLGARRFLTFY
jgi:hypothetical protein